MNFEEKNYVLAKLCQIVVGPQFQLLPFKVAYFLGGKTSEKCPFNPKISQIFM